MALLKYSLGGFCNAALLADWHGPGIVGNMCIPCRTYRGLYILNWIYRYLTEPNYRQWIVWVSGALQTALYVDFFYYYFLAWRSNKKLQLPS